MVVWKPVKQWLHVFKQLLPLIIIAIPVSDAEMAHFTFTILTWTVSVR